MSEFCFFNTINTNFYSLLLSDFIFFCSIILSHPLYFSYLMFFSPYLVRLVSFLSPLFMTTSLLLLAFLTISSGLPTQDFAPDVSGSKVGFCISSFHKVLDALRSQLDNDVAEFCLFEELEACTVVFDTTCLDIEEHLAGNSQTRYKENCPQTDETQVVNCSDHQAGSSVSEVLDYNVEENPLQITRQKLEGISQKGLLEETSYKEDTEVRPLDTVLNKVRECQMKLQIGTGSEAQSYMGTENPLNVSSDNAGENTSQELNGPLVPNLGSFGLMRKEKEWKRTLAYKLYEERQNVDKEEGMDLLWEAYEAESGKVKVENRDKEKEKEKKTKKCRVEYDEDEEEDEETAERLCCLQALRFSTGKMKLGMGRSNLVRLSKALKGIGWLHRVSRHCKKG
ncbi:PREDICTED: uncharacterized protein LOC104609430 [Nelumbo nucifera]|uniref:Uncharacterized protein LOC104609430 n=1 Tax=Nelumbo nucifera TaxID=4432 RepID=A0A1U8B3Z3_NELNU|nr:PREDICTED: uncharacterized protein LOC104609430 [Nelumbo nucifera]